MDDPTTVFTRMLHAVDALDWATVRAAFADTVRVDYTELAGGEVEDVAADELIGRWQSIFPGFGATQHITGPCILTPEDNGVVRVDTHVRSFHRIADAEGGPIWGVHGHYLARVRAGLITALTLQLFYQEGNIALPALATARAARPETQRQPR
ncbi:nuclear transport factor 2 family protein [Pseudonocardia sp. TRM90224]|uniref:nuclear transport factor 2 family protein n=1 Tax=Pseudonocardia sp. TRM90224 TaxID=2812678 RepID=UPI001E60A239|nr:nuclear transport factor 2 family protein [Pseudonocardia sp. TRM90224]